MATKKTQKKGNGAMLAMEIGAGVLAAASAAAAAGYFFYGTENAEKHRAAAKTWARGLKKDVTAEVKKLKKIDAASVSAAVEKAAKNYTGMKNVAMDDLKMATKELKKNWKMMKEELAPSKEVKKVVKSVSPKNIAKTAKKMVTGAKAPVKSAAKKRA